MSVWKFDENRAAFGPASLDEIEADPCGLYILWRGDEVMVREDGIERPMPERLTVAGVPFDREQFEVPAGVQRQPVVGQHIGPPLLF